MPVEADGAGEGDAGSLWTHDFQAAADDPNAAHSLRNLDLMLDVPLDVAVELGRAQMPLADLLALEPGSVVELDRLPGEPIDMYVNGRLVARGEIVVVNETLAFRITDILPHDMAV
jgi:flagellar motor switch protein FliN/FliY